MATRVWPVDAVAGAPLYSGRMLRQSMMAPLLAGARTGRPLGARSGVRPGTPASTVTATSTTWTVGAHAGVLDVQSASEAGPYGYAFDASVTGSVTAANATNPRVDIVSVQLSDPAEADGTTTPGVDIVYTAGTAAASPTAPTAPARSIVLAQINVPASGGGTPTITWVAPYLAAAGAPIRVRSMAEATALISVYAPSPESPLWVEHIGASNALAGRIARHDGTSWTTLTGTGPVQTPTKATGWATVHSSRPEAFWIEGDWCVLSGVSVRAAGLSALSNTAFLSGLPPITTSGTEYPMIPVGVSQLGSGLVAGASAYVNIRADGGLRVACTANIGSNAVITLDGARYRIS